MIEIFPSKREGGPLERHPLEQATTIEAWLKAKVRGYESRPVPPITDPAGQH